MKKPTRILILCLSLVFLLGIIGGGIFAYLRYTRYTEKAFDRSYGITCNVYGNFYGSYAVNHPEFAISKSGELYVLEYDSENNKRVPAMVGRLVPIQITEKNFDNIFTGGGWLAIDTNAEVIRQHTDFAWKCEGNNGTLYYVILYPNGNAALAYGWYQEGYALRWMYGLEGLGDADVFHERHKD